MRNDLTIKFVWHFVGVLKHLLTRAIDPRFNSWQWGHTYRHVTIIRESLRNLWDYINVSIFKAYENGLWNHDIFLLMIVVICFDARYISKFVTYISSCYEIVNWPWTRICFPQLVFKSPPFIAPLCGHWIVINLVSKYTHHKISI